MRPRVVADLGACLEDSAQGVAAPVLGSEAAEREERRVTVVRRQEVEDGARPGRRPVVERQREDVFVDVMSILERGH
jgi:hypothetical protein